jgi:replicative DNA helicase
MIDEAFERKVLACLYRVRDFCTVSHSHLKPSHFEDIVRHNMSKMAMDFWDKYHAPISSAAYADSLKNLIARGTISKEDILAYAEEHKKIYKIDITDWEYTLDKLITFIKNREIKKLIEDSIKKHLPKDDFDSIESTMAAIASIKTSKDNKPMDYFSEDEINKRTEKRMEEAEMPTIGISTGIKRLDDALPKKGWYPGELSVIMAPPKRGKTMSLLYFANMAAWQGFNAAYFSLEVSKSVISERLDALNTNTDMKHLTVPAHIKDVAKSLKTKTPPGKLLVWEYPTKSCTTTEIERQLKIVEAEGTKIDALFVDYGDIMRSNRQYENHLKEEASIFEDLRAIAGKLNIPVITPTQVNRDGSSKELITGRNVAGTWEKIMVADYIISLSASDSELADNILKIHLAECRNAPSKTIKIKTAFNMGKFYGEFIEEVR